MEILSSDEQQRALLSPTRIYDPLVGRFIQSDPLLKNSIMGIGVEITPIPKTHVGKNEVVSQDRHPRPLLPSFMGYLFGEQNPVMRIDASGLQGDDVVGPNAQQTLQNILNQVTDPGHQAENFGIGLNKYATKQEDFLNVPPYQQSGPKAIKDAAISCIYTDAANEGWKFLSKTVLPSIGIELPTGPSNVQARFFTPFTSNKDLGRLWGVEFTIRF